MKLPLFLLLCTIGYSAAAQDPDAYRKLKDKADSLAKTDNLLQAEATYLKALNIFSDDPILKRNLASIYLRMGKVNNADKFIASAIENGATMHVLLSDLSIDSYFKMYPEKNEAYSARVRQRKLIMNMEDKKSWMDDHRKTFTNNNYYH
jgi:tetratricopeptide (TPR) repeat protein